MSVKIRLTDEEKEILKNAIPYIKNEEWDKAFREIENEDRYGLEDEYNQVLHILAFLKNIGIDLLRKTTVINQWAFIKCTELVSIVIHGNVKKIEVGAFCRCTKLESVKIEDGVEEICFGAFQACKQLSKIIIPCSVKVIGKYIFSNGCDLLEEITYDGTIDEWKQVSKDINWSRNSKVRTVKCSNGSISA